MTCPPKTDPHVKLDWWIEGRQGDEQTVYGSDGFMKSDNNIVNSANVKLNADGTFTVYFGAAETCGEVPNRLDATEGWNFLMRIYRPGKSVLEGAYTLPEAKPVK